MPVLVLMPFKKLRMLKSGFIVTAVFLVIGYVSWAYLLNYESTLTNGNGGQEEELVLKRDDLNYGVVVDCGSSGSRLFVYYWRQHSGVPGELLKITNLMDKNNKTVVIKKEPGLSSFADRPSGAIDYLSPLLQFAVDHIPADKLKQTPLYIMATAGLRLLTQVQQQAILTNLRSNIPRQFDFIFSDSHIEIISGKWEGLYAWIAVNLALGKFDHKPDAGAEGSLGGGGEAHVRKKTVGAMDLGGASMQTTFELPPSMLHLSPQIKDSVLELDLGCTEHSNHRYRLFTQTFLGFGGNEAQKRQRLKLLQTVLNSTTTTSLATPSTAPATITTAASSPASSLPSLLPLSHDDNIDHITNNVNNTSDSSNKAGKDTDAMKNATPLHTQRQGGADDDATSAPENSVHKVVRRAVERRRSTEEEEGGGQLVVEDPCSPRGYRELVQASPPSRGDVAASNGTVAYTLEGKGDLDGCLSVVRGLLDKSRCPLSNRKQCAMQGVVIPDINYRIIEFYGFSEFYYTMEDILGISGHYNYQLFYTKAKEYCQTAWSQIEEWQSNNKHPQADSHRYRSQCFKSAWLMTLLHEGLNLPKHFKHFTSISQLNGHELHWSLGALLHKTRYYPLRDIERTQEAHTRGHKRWAHKGEFIIMIFLLGLLAAVLLYICLKSSSPFKFLSRKSRVTLHTEQDFDPHVVLVGELKSHDKKMVRSRSSGTFTSSAYALV